MSETPTQEKPFNPLWEFGVVVAVFGWIWFASMVAVKMTGATIYATTDAAVIERMDEVFNPALKTRGPLTENGFRFHIRIGDTPEKRQQP